MFRINRDTKLIGKKIKPNPSVKVKFVFFYQKSSKKKHKPFTPEYLCINYVLSKI